MKNKIVYAVFKDLYENKDDLGNLKTLHRELLKAFNTEDEAHDYIMEYVEGGKLTDDEYNSGYDLNVQKTTLEALWVHLNMEGLL